VFPPFPEYTDKVDIYASMEAAKDIGGDFYDFFRIDDDHIALVVADVCGKGIPAALFMAVSRTIIRSKGMQGCSAETCMTESNHLLAAYSIDNMFVTVFYAIYNVKTGFISYSNAGHNPPLLLRQDGSVSELPVMENTIVGVIDNIEYQKDTLQLEQGDTLFMFTDGVTEATDAAYNEFGVERLGDILSQHSHSNCQQIVEAVKKGVKDFVGETEQSDDITMLVVKRL
jgi:sigma-B regulation protein RsbU (phosphoserine phosphatase)